jgi:hypothetical protein
VLLLLRLLLRLCLLLLLLLLLHRRQGQQRIRGAGMQSMLLMLSNLVLLMKLLLPLLLPLLLVGAGEQARHRHRQLLRDVGWCANRQLHGVMSWQRRLEVGGWLQQRTWYRAGLLWCGALQGPGQSLHLLLPLLVYLLLLGLLLQLPRRLVRLHERRGVGAQGAVQGLQRRRKRTT